MGEFPERIEAGSQEGPMGRANVRNLNQTMLSDRKLRPRSQWAHITRAARKPELSFNPELQHEARNRTEYKLGLVDAKSLHNKLYRPEMRPSIEGRKAALSAAIRESLGDLKADDGTGQA